ncbi:MAG TPA: hypothetical protein VFU65_00510 [Actinocrinis sp.]|nr:hypothetical protein [Actinocrinis sp.]
MVLLRPADLGMTDAFALLPAGTDERLRHGCRERGRDQPGDILRAYEQRPDLRGWGQIGHVAIASGVAGAQVEATSPKVTSRTWYGAELPSASSPGRPGAAARASRVCRDGFRVNHRLT